MHPEGTGVGHQGHWGRIELAYDHIDILLQFDYIFLNKRYLSLHLEFLGNFFSRESIRKFYLIYKAEHIYVLFIMNR